MPGLPVIVPPPPSHIEMHDEGRNCVTEQGFRAIPPTRSSTPNQFQFFSRVFLCLSFPAPNNSSETKPEWGDLDKRFFLGGGDSQHSRYNYPFDLVSPTWKKSWIRRNR